MESSRDSFREPFRHAFKWMRLFGMKAAPRYNPPPQGTPPEPPLARVPPLRGRAAERPRLLTRKEWLVMLLLAFVPVAARDLLEEDIWECWQWGHARAPLAWNEYALLGTSGERCLSRTRFAARDCAGQEVQRLSQRLTDEWGFVLRALSTPDEQLGRTMRAALLVVEGARLGQLWAALEQTLPPQQVLEVFRQSLTSDTVA